jgi:hypothetical protein
MGASGTFRGVVGSDGWVRSDEMEYRRSGGLAKGLRSVGVKCVIMGDLLDEVRYSFRLYTYLIPGRILPDCLSLPIYRRPLTKFGTLLCPRKCEIDPGVLSQAW